MYLSPRRFRILRGCLPSRLGIGGRAQAIRRIQRLPSSSLKNMTRVFSVMPSSSGPTLPDGWYHEPVIQPMKLSIALFTLTVALAQNPDPGQQAFESRCASCHGGDGAGGEHGPAIVSRLARRTDADLTRLIREGLPTRGMPAFNLPDREMNALIGFLRTLRPRRPLLTERAKVDMTDGRALEGLVLNQSSEDMQLQTDDKRIHLLRKTGARYREVTSQTDWPSYNGETRGYRYSKLDQINRSNVARLAPKA